MMAELGFDCEGLLTESMLEEEKLSVKQAEREEVQAREEASDRMRHTAKEESYNHLKFLLEKSQIYAKYIHDRISEQKQIKLSRPHVTHTLTDVSEQPRSQRRGRKSTKGRRSSNCQISVDSPSVKRGSKRSIEQSTGEDLSENIRTRRCKTDCIVEENNNSAPVINQDDEVCKEKSSAVDSQHNDDINSKVSINDVIEQPRLLVGAQLRPYQSDGYKWLMMLYENGINGILADEMGLGKTIQCIALICHLVENKVMGPFLIIAPLSTIHNWIYELKKFSPSLPYILYHGSKSERTELRRNMSLKQSVKSDVGSYETSPIVITSFEIAMRDKVFLADLQWKLLIIDEGHRIKNYNCRLIRELRQYNSPHRLLLTGTPLQNSLTELWSLLNFLIPEIFDSLDSFKTWFDVEYLETAENAAEEIIVEELKKHTISMMHQILCPFMLRRLKSDANLSIPPKKEILVYAGLSEVQQRYYKAIIDGTIRDILPGKVNEDDTVLMNINGRPLRKTRVHSDQFSILFNDDDSDDDDDKSENWAKSVVEYHSKKAEMYKSSVSVKALGCNSMGRISLRNAVAMLRRCCNHPYLIHYPHENSKVNTSKRQIEFLVNEDLISDCGKLSLLDEMLNKLKPLGHKMTSVLDILEDYCAVRKYRYCRLDGSMKVEDRQQQIEEFNKEELFLFLISTRAGGLGINLVQADTVIIYDSDWNPQCDLQAQDRCHRIGQTRPVVVYRLVTVGTIDEKIVERARAKRTFEKLVIHEGQFKTCTDAFSMEMRELSIDDLRSLLEQSSSSEAQQVTTSRQLNQLLDRSDLINDWKQQQQQHNNSTNY